MGGSKIVAVNDCPYIPFCQQECTPNYKDCEVYDFIEYLLERQNRRGRITKKIYRQEHGHRHYEYIKSPKDVDIEGIIGMLTDGKSN